jgi:hypothetical protein
MGCTICCRQFWRGRRPAALRQHDNGGVVWSVAGLQTKTGNGVDLISDLQFEEMEAPLKDQEETCIERR